MGTSNFRGCGRFGIWAAIDEYDAEFYEAEYPDLSDEQRYEIHAEDANIGYERCYYDAKDAVRDLNYELTFYKLGVAPGYYEGVEIVLDWEPPSEDPEDLAEIYEEELKPWWVDRDANKTKKKHLLKVQKAYDEECEKIERWLETTGRDCGFYPLDTVARFGNGETWYRRSGQQQSEAYEGDNGLSAFFSKSRKKKTARRKSAGRRWRP